MTSQPDQLFRDKLEHFSKPVPAGSWGRIESDLNKTNYRGLWMKIAAGFILLTIAAIALLPGADPATPERLTLAPVEKNTEVEPVAAPQISASPNQQINKSANHRISTSPNQHIIKKVEPELIANNSEVLPEENPVVEVEETEAVVAMVDPQSEEKSTSKTIVYTADEVNARFLKKELPVEATSDEKKSSGIQKLMDVAYTIKNTDKSLGDLRQKKDEILALNFKEKKTGQN